MRHWLLQMCLELRGLFSSADIIPLLWKRLRAGFDSRNPQIVSADFRIHIGLLRLRFEPPSGLIFLLLLPSFFLVAFLGRRS
jgi:hypothetical protein